MKSQPITKPVMSAKEFIANMVLNLIKPETASWNIDDAIKKLEKRDAQIRTLAREQTIEECAEFVEVNAPTDPIQKSIGGKNGYGLAYAKGLRALKTPKHAGATK